MPKIILLPMSGTSADTDTLDLAFAAGRLFNAHLVALHVRPEVRDIAGLAASDAGTSAAIGTMIDRMEADPDQREQPASETWRAFCEQNGIAITEIPTENGVTSE